MNDPWKKVRSGRFAQLLRDRISERRRKGGGSNLVVETGFPTSIIDLFVKNKDRLKNPLLKKKIKNDDRALNKSNWSGNDVNNGVTDVLLPPPPPPPFSGGELVVEDEVVSGNSVVVAVLRLFLVVVLALGTKMFVVGITFSAFLLLFLEYLVKQELIRPPCIESKEMISLMVKKLMGFWTIQRGNPEESNSVEIQEEQGMMMMMSDSSRVAETEIEENEIQCEKENEAKVLCIKDILSVEDGEELRTRKSPGAKMRVKMRKFLSKRLRKKKALNVDDGVESVASIAEENDQRELSSYGGSSLSSISRDVDELVEEETRTQVIEHSSSSYMALLVVVLVGLLVGGRGLASILTVSWCLLLKSGGAIGRRWTKASILRSPANVVHCS